MGVAASTCIKQKNPTPQLEFPVPVILKRKITGRRPHKQNLLVPPLAQLGESEESLDQLDLILQDANLNCSIHKTATFCSNNRQSIKEKLDLSLNLMTPSTVQTQINPNLSFQETPKGNQKQVEHQVQRNVQRETKESQFKIKAEKQNGKRDQYAKSLSSNSRAKKQQNQNEESSQSLKRDSETNTKKSILKNKNQQIITNQLKRGVSLRQQQQQNDDTQSQKTSKSQQKKVQFDPKIFRPKNTHFFQ